MKNEALNELLFFTPLASRLRGRKIFPSEENFAHCCSSLVFSVRQGLKKAFLFCETKDYALLKSLPVKTKRSEAQLYVILYSQLHLLGRAPFDCAQDCSKGGELALSLSKG